MALLRSPFYLTPIPSCQIDVDYILGLKNALADAVSHGRLQVLRQLHPSANWQPTQQEAIPTLPGEANHLPPCTPTVGTHERQQVVNSMRPENMSSAISAACTCARSAKQATPFSLKSLSTLQTWQTYLADVARATPTSIKKCLSSVLSLHVDRGLPGPPPSTPLTQCVLAGVKRVHDLHPPLQRLSVLRSILVRLIEHLQKASWLLTANKLMLNAASTLAFHCFLRFSELTTNLARSSAHIIAAPLRYIKLSMQASKKKKKKKLDPFRRGSTITIGASSRLCCPVYTLSQ